MTTECEFPAFCEGGCGFRLVAGLISQPRFERQEYKDGYCKDCYIVKLEADNAQLAAALESTNKVLDDVLGKLEEELKQLRARTPQPDRQLTGGFGAQ